jgi:hypothetical protein
MEGKFLNADLTTMEGVLFNKSMGFTKENGNRFKLTSS